MEDYAIEETFEERAARLRAEATADAYEELAASDLSWTLEVR